MKNLTLISTFLFTLLCSSCTNSDGTLISLPKEENATTPLFYAEATIEGEPIKQIAGIGGIVLKRNDVKSVLGIEDLTKGKTINNVIETQIGDFIFSFYAAEEYSVKLMLAQPKKKYAEDRDGKLSYSVAAKYEDLSSVGVQRPDSVFWYVNDKLIKKGETQNTNLSYAGENYPQSVALETNYYPTYSQKLRQTRYNFFGNSNINGNVRPFTLPISSGTTNILGLSVTQSNIGFNWDDFVITSTFPLDPKEGEKKHCVTVTDNRNAATSASACVISDLSKSPKSLKAPNFAMTSQQVLKGDFWDRVAISYRYKDGFTYRSDLQPQPATSTYEVLDVKDDIPIDNQGITVRSYTIRFNCMLYNVEGKKIQIQDGMARISVK